MDLFCTRCNILVDARVCLSGNAPVSDEAGQDIPDFGVDRRADYEVALCGRCNGPFLLETVSYELEGSYETVTSRRVLFPVQREAQPRGLPEPIDRPYQQAVRSFQAALHEPCVIMCRKTLEALCSELGAARGTLKDRLMELVTAGKLDRRLFDWADQLRVVGNDAAHDLEVLLTADDARDSLEFVEAILASAYTLSRRFEAFKRRRQARSSEGNAP